MSSKALASALFGYGADIKVKNIVMEIFFSILPPVYMSNYQIISPTDELIVDLFPSHDRGMFLRLGLVKYLLVRLGLQEFVSHTGKTSLLSTRLLAR